jgi:hypothetical protein
MLDRLRHLTLHRRLDMEFGAFECGRKEESDKNKSSNQD